MMSETVRDLQVLHKVGQSAGVAHFALRGSPEGSSRSPYAIYRRRYGSVYAYLRRAVSY
eukprot:COSAG02_NODE_28568_length_587_cov_0.907787_1_plen_59_part_00